MGRGHLIPGVFFIIYGSWWCFNSMWLYISMGQEYLKKNHENHPKNGSIFKKFKYALFFKYKQDLSLNKKSWIPAHFLPPWIPLEPILKIVLSLMGIFAEEFLAMDENNHLFAFVYHIRKPDGTLDKLEKFYHIIMYFGFLLSGVVDLFTICLRFPAQTSTIVLSISFLSEGLLFYFHTIGRNNFNILIHLLLVYVIASCFLFTLLRLYSPSNVVINLGLGNSILFQGTWLIQIGYFIFGGFLGKNEEITNKHLMLVTAYFAWHLLAISAGNLVVMGALSAIINKRHVLLDIWKRRRKSQDSQMDFQPEECSNLIISEDDKKTDKKIEMEPVTESVP